ncbi:MAG: hypothetical protein NT012_00790 [Candidatus Nealsonbacteria bacterium]|nr:hypothetical protein [Candidatus Nealsonbacteria bacterium]
MMERFRILVAQVVTGLVTVISTIWFCRKVIIEAHLIAKIYYLQINSVLIAQTIGLISIACLGSKFLIWIMKNPKINEGEIKEKEVDMGRVKNIGKYTNK